jgi:hypothetical protein
MSRLTIGPVNSGNKAFDVALSDYLQKNGYTQVAHGTDWTKEFKDQVAADAAADAANAKIHDLAIAYSPLLPHVVLF